MTIFKWGINMLSDSDIINIGMNGADLIKDELGENFHQKKFNSLLLADSYYRLEKFNKAKRVRGCGAYMEYRLDPNRLNEQGYQRLYKAYLCGDILCPICQWRRARKISNQLAATMAHISESGSRFIFLTLTIQNVTDAELQPATNNLLREAWKKFISRKDFKNSIQGYYRTFEITHDTEEIITPKMYQRKREYYNRHGLKVGNANPAYDTYHPHIHSIIAVKPSYFNKNRDEYINQKEWRMMWAQALGVDYDPFVDVRVVYDKNKENGSRKKISNISAILESAKYTTKSNDYIVRGANGEIDEEKTDIAVYAISSSLARRRLISYGGVFKQAHRELHLDKIEGGDLLHTQIDETKGLDDFITFKCIWSGKNGYSVAPVMNEDEE
jgi:plasmid rolling circle replication initiator protein Rep